MTNFQIRGFHEDKFMMKVKSNIIFRDLKVVMHSKIRRLTELQNIAETVSLETECMYSLSYEVFSYILRGCVELF